MNKFRLVYPYESDKIYNKETIIKAADECYNELKNSNNNTNFFCIMNLDKNHIYNFEITKHKKNNTQKKIKCILDSTKTDELENKIDYLQKKIKKYKNKLKIKKNNLINNNDLIYNNNQILDISELHNLKINNKINKNNKNNDNCKIM